MKSESEFPIPSPFRNIKTFRGKPKTEQLRNTEKPRKLHELIHAEIYGVFVV